MSILTLIILQDGLVWRVGDGREIKIWQDRWIPSPTTYSIQSPVSILDVEARVSLLIDVDTKWWNKHLVHAIFNKEEAQSSPLSMTTMC